MIVDELAATRVSLVINGQLALLNSMCLKKCLIFGGPLQQVQ